MTVGSSGRLLVLVLSLAPCGGAGCCPRPPLPWRWGGGGNDRGFSIRKICYRSFCRQGDQDKVYYCGGQQVNDRQLKPLELLNLRCANVPINLHLLQYWHQIDFVALGDCAESDRGDMETGMWRYAAREVRRVSTNPRREVPASERLSKLPSTRLCAPKRPCLKNPISSLSSKLPNIDTN